MILGILFIIFLCIVGLLFITTSEDRREARHRRAIRELDMIINGTTKVSDEIFYQEDHKFDKED